MSALLDREHPVGERLLHGEGGRLDPGLLGEGGVVNLGGVAVPLGPAQVHPQQHGREVGRVDTAGFGANRHQRIALVVLTGQQGADLERLDVGGQSLQVALRLGESGRIVLLHGEFDQHAEIVHSSPQGGDPVHLGLQPGKLRGDGLGIVLVVPQVRGCRLLGELGNLGLLGRWVEDGLDRLKSAVEDGQIGLEVCSGHS